MFLTSCQSQPTFFTFCQSQSMFLTVAAGPLTRVSRAMSNASFERPPTVRDPDPKRHPRLSSGDMASCSSHTFVHLPGLSVSSPYQLDFRFPALSRWSALGAPPPLAPTRPGHGGVSLVPLRALRQSSSTLWRPLATFVMSAAVATVPRALDALLVNAQNPASPELVATTFGVVADETRRRPPSIMYEDEFDRRVFVHPAQSLSEKTSTTSCSGCLLWTTRHLGLPFRNHTRRLRACMFWVFGCCIRLASSFTANCISHLS